MDAIGLILAIAIGGIQALLATVFVLLPLKAEASPGSEGCATVLPTLVLIPMTLFDAALFCFLKADGSLLQKFGVAFGGASLFGALLIALAVRATVTGNPGIRAAYRSLVYIGLIADLFFLVGLGSAGVHYTLTLSTAASVFLTLIGLPAALIIVAVSSGRRQSTLPPQRHVGDVTYLPPRG